jgi:hypothetical protein
MAISSALALRAACDMGGAGGGWWGGPRPSAADTGVAVGHGWEHRRWVWTRGQAQDPTDKPRIQQVGGVQAQVALCDGGGRLGSRHPAALCLLLLLVLAKIGLVISAVLAVHWVQEWLIISVDF